MSSVIENDNGFEYLENTYFPNTDGGGTPGDPLSAPIEIPSAITPDTPFDSIILKPTAAAFDTGCSLVTFVTPNGEQIIMVVFADATGVAMLEILDVADPTPGMWVIVQNTETGITDATQITDGTNILIPEVNLAELTGITEATLGEINQLSGADIFLQNGDSLAAIDGCEIVCRFTLIEYIQYLARSKSRWMYQSEVDALSEEDINALPNGTFIAVKE